MRKLLYDRMFRTVQTHDRKDSSTIVTASSRRDCKDATICVWVRKHPREKTDEAGNRGDGIPSAIETMIGCLMLIGIVIFSLQKWGPQVSSELTTYGMDVSLPSQS